jgi:hypothetical protein
MLVVLVGEADDLELVVLTAGVGVALAPGVGSRCHWQC